MFFNVKLIFNIEASVLLENMHNAAYLGIIWEEPV